MTCSWDDNGNLPNHGAKSYGYDQANRLKQVVQGAITTTLAYNGVGDRLSQTVGAATTHYVLDPGAGLTQVLADGTNSYLYGNDRLGQYQGSMHYFGPDGLGSVRQIFDASAQVVGSARYDPYGNVLAQSGATSIFAFAGEQYDAGTGLEYLRARYYSAAQGRFVTRDVWDGDPNVPMSYNAWNYTNGNPVNRTDPTGKCEESGDGACWAIYDEIVRSCPECAEMQRSSPLKTIRLSQESSDYLQTVLERIRVGWRPSLIATQYIESIRREAKSYGIPWQVLGGVLEAEIRQDTKWYDPIETLAVAFAPPIAGTWFTPNPGPGIGNVHASTAHSTARYFSKFYPGCPELSLDIKPNEANWRVAGRLTHDPFTIKVMAAHVRELADWRFGSDGKPLLTSHNILSDWRIEDGVAVWHAYRYGVRNITPEGTGFTLGVFQNRSLTLSQLIQTAGGTDGGLNISKSVPTFERYFAIPD